MKPGKEAGHFFIIEEGEVAFVDPVGVCSTQKSQISKLNIALTIGRMGFVGDELLVGYKDYAFTSVSLRQPSILYICDRGKFLKAWAILGREVMILLRQQTALRIKFRAERLAASAKSDQLQEVSSPPAAKPSKNAAYSNSLTRDRRSDP